MKIIKLSYIPSHYISQYGISHLRFDGRIKRIFMMFLDFSGEPCHLVESGKVDRFYICREFHSVIECYGLPILFFMTMLSNHEKFFGFKPSPSKWFAYNFFVWPNFALNFQTSWSEKISNLHKLNAFLNVEDHFEASSYKKYMFLKIRLTQNCRILLKYKETLKSLALGFMGGKARDWQ